MVIKQILEYYIKLRQTNNLEKLEKFDYEVKNLMNSEHISYKSTESY